MYELFQTIFNWIGYLYTAGTYSDNIVANGAAASVLLASVALYIVGLSYCLVKEAIGFVNDEPWLVMTDIEGGQKGAFYMVATLMYIVCSSIAWAVAPWVFVVFLKIWPIVSVLIGIGGFLFLVRASKRLKKKLDTHIATPAKEAHKGSQEVSDD